MWIKFKKSSWVMEQRCGGWSGCSRARAVRIKPEAFEVVEIDKDKENQCAQILAWTDGAIDGDRHYLINVPWGLFEIVDENDVNV